MANVFLEDDEELKKKKHDDDDDEDEEKDEEEYDEDDDTDNDDDSDDSDNSDDSVSDNDYLGDYSESDSDDWDDNSEGDYESGDDGDFESDDNSTSNDYISGDDNFDSEGDSASGSSESAYGMLVKATYANVIACNNFEHVHLMCAGKKFDTIHGITDNLVGKVHYKTDTLAELALEDENVEMDNFCNAAKYVPEMAIEAEKTYDYETACTAVAETLRKLIDIITEARNAVDKPHVQSKLDDYLVTLNKEYNFLMKRRMKNVDESVEYNSYI